MEDSEEYPDRCKEPLVEESNFPALWKYKTRKGWFVIAIAITLIVLFFNSTLWLMVKAKVPILELIPMKQSERLFNSRETLEKIDYKEAGDILKETWNYADVFAPVEYEVKYAGDEAFHNLGKKLLTDNKGRCSESETAIYCMPKKYSVNRIKVSLSDDGSESSILLSGSMGNYGYLDYRIKNNIWFE